MRARRNEYSDKIGEIINTEKFKSQIKKIKESKNIIQYCVYVKN